MWNKILIFVKAQLSAFVGGITSYLVTVFMREIFLHQALHNHDISYIQSLIAVGTGETLGAIVNFTINKTWAFKSKGNQYKHKLLVQFWRFIVVLLQSVLLKATGVHLLNNFFSKIDFKIWLLFIYFIVSIGNYLLQKYWVFNSVPLKGFPNEISKNEE